MRAAKQSPGGKKIPPHVQDIIRARILAHAEKTLAGRYVRMDVRFRGASCYIDAYIEPSVPEGLTPPEGMTRPQWIEDMRNTPTHLCRIGYTGSADRWSFAYYTYSHERYDASFLVTGEHFGTPEEALETSTMFL